jgi:serine/threonine protein kinase
MSANIHAEYGMSKEISTKGDVYSFGVLLLEMITGYRPTDEKLKDGISLQDFVGQSFPNNIDEIVSPVMVQDSINAAKVMQNCILPLVKIGLSCSMASPKERPGMDEVCNKILTIKHIFSKMYSST